MREDEGATHVVLAGELDLATMSVAEEALGGVPSGDGAVVLDLRKLGFLDSSGLRLILTFAGSKDSQRSVYVVKGPAQVNRVFELTGAGERLNLVDDPSLIGKA